MTCDYTVTSGSREFPCHRVILRARSRVFNSGITVNMLEGTEGRWDVKDSNPQAVDAMMKHIYTGDIPEEVKLRPLELLQLANQYELEDLEEATRDIILTRLTVENAVTTLIEIDRYGAGKTEGKDQVIEFIKKHAKADVESENWEHFVNNYGTLVTNIVSAVTN